MKDLGLHSKALQEQLDRYSAISDKYATVFCYEKYPTKLPAGMSVKVRHALHISPSLMTPI
jgi:hypothetical protein